MQNLVQSFYNWYRNTLRNTKYRWVLILGTLLYLLSPIDIAPDFIPIVGWIDDGIVATLFVTEVSQLLLERLKSGQKTASTEVADASVVDTDKTVVDVKAS
ncbi:MAG: YkvA family protein [Cyanobacteria bacterium J06592_8]